MNTSDNCFIALGNLYNSFNTQIYKPETNVKLDYLQGKQYLIRLVLVKNNNYVDKQLKNAFKQKAKDLIER